MPAGRLSQTPSTVKTYDVLGKDGDTQGLVAHAMLCNEASPRNDVTHGAELEVVHMGPPFEAASREAHVTGSADLTEKQRMKIKTFVDRQLPSAKAEKSRQAVTKRPQYVIHKSIEPPAGKYSCWRFSCIGFVLKAYQTARIKLLAEPRPLKTVAQIQELYSGEVAEALDNENFRKRYGLATGTGVKRNGEEAWPIDLVGYVFHALNRDASTINGPAAIPYQPQAGDEYFPRLDAVLVDE